VIWGLPMFSGAPPPTDDRREEVLGLAIGVIQRSNPRFRAAEDLTFRVSQFMGRSWTWQQGQWAFIEPPTV